MAIGPPLHTDWTRLALRTDKLRTALQQGLVITASILFAFALDAWWDEYRQQVELSEVMEALKADFQGVQAELGRALFAHQRQSDGLDGFIGLMGPEPTGAQMDSVSQAIRQINYTTTELPQGVLTALISTGALSGIEDVELRNRLSAWPARVDNYMETERRVSGGIEEVRAMMRGLAPQGGFPPQPRALLTSFELSNEMRYWRRIVGSLNRENEGLEAEAAGILADIHRDWPAR